MMCAVFVLLVAWEIFSRALRAWMPTCVTPIGQAALPIDSFR